MLKQVDYIQDHHVRIVSQWRHLFFARASLAFHDGLDTSWTAICVQTFAHHGIGLVEVVNRIGRSSETLS